jgi:hypothetical protein
MIKPADTFATYCDGYSRILCPFRLQDIGVHVPQKTRNAPLPVMIAIAALGVALVLVSIVYFTSSAAGLPSWLPGHQVGSAHHHVKHGVVACLLGVLALVAAWIGLGRADDPAGGKSASQRPD